MGGPMKEYFTLVMQWLFFSQLFCGSEHDKFLSYQASSIEQNEYYFALFAGLVIAMSLVNGGPGPRCLASKMFQALAHGLECVVIDVDDVYDKELQNSLKLLHDAPTVAAATKMLHNEKLTTVLDLAGTLQQIKTTEDAKKIAALKAKWYVIGRANASFEAFENGLSALGVLDAIRRNPKAFESSFCHTPSLVPRRFGLFTSLSARGKAREGEKWKIRREAHGRIRIQNGGSVFCKCSVLFILLLK